MDLDLIGINLNFFKKIELKNFYFTCKVLAKMIQ
jgi:hypothetical protein